MIPAILSETLLTRMQAAKLARVHWSTIAQWWRQNRLEYAWLGDRRVTSVEAIQRFHERNNDTTPVEVSSPWKRYKRGDDARIRINANGRMR